MFGLNGGCLSSEDGSFIEGGHSFRVTSTARAQTAVATELKPPFSAEGDPAFGGGGGCANFPQKIIDFRPDSHSLEEPG